MLQASDPERNPDRLPYPASGLIATLSFLLTCGFNV